MITVYGASDDLVEIEGDVRAEFDLIDEVGYVVTSTGVVVRIEYSRSGLWKVDAVQNGDGVTVERAVDPDSKNYSDRLTVPGEISWIVFGKGYQHVYAHQNEEGKR